MINVDPRGSTHIFYWRRGGGGRSEWFFLGSEILSKSDFLGSMKDTGSLLGREKNRDFLGLWKKEKGNFLGMLKK